MADKEDLVFWVRTRVTEEQRQFIESEADHFGRTISHMLREYIALAMELRKTRPHEG